MSTLLLSMLATASVYAAPLVNFKEYIPASACQIRDNDDLGKADLVDGSWQVNAGITDDIELICPLRVTVWLRDESVDIFNVNYRTQWAYFESFHRDIDGDEPGSSVESTLFDVSDFAMNFLYFLASMDDVATDTWYSELMPDDPLEGDFNHVVVVLSQGTGTNRVRLTSLRFFAALPG